MTIKDIARICGVGIGTVSRAINNDPRVSEKTQEKILRAVKEHHYVPNNSARNLKMAESNTIGLLFSGIDNPFFQGMISIFENACDELGYSFFLYAVRENDRVENVAMEVCKERRLKGLIILGGQLSFPNRRLDSLGVPYVLCTVTVPRDGDALQEYEFVRDLQHDSGAVARLAIRALGAAVAHVLEHGQGVVHQLVGLVAPDVDDHPDSAGIMFRCRVV